MLLDALKDFEWYNEPENVRFNELGMVINTKPKTDFWQSTHHNFHKDNGHFFYTRAQGDFSLLVKWSFDKAYAFDQCGLMLRVDGLNWFKLSLMSETIDKPKLGSSLTNFGYSDWAVVDLNTAVSEIWYKLQCCNGDYIAFYSLDGEVFHQLRLFHLVNDQGEIKVGAYAAAPQRSDFECILEILDLT